MDKSFPKEVKEMIAQLSEHRRTAYLPVTSSKEASFSQESKFGGYPYLRNEKDWPICPGCMKHMTLFLQLDRRNLPERKSTKVLQLFYCITQKPILFGLFKSETCEDAMVSPFSNTVVCREFEPLGESAQIKVNSIQTFPERRIDSWEAKDDYPYWVEYDRLGIHDASNGEVYEYLDSENIFTTIEGDKLLGWPNWLQFGTEYPIHPETGSLMEYLFQIDSQRNIPYMFGDGGIGYLFESKSKMAFSWNCT